MNRGKFIVFEGIDRCGKTTQCQILLDKLRQKNIRAEIMRFPNRETESGKIINSFLLNKITLSDREIHLLFAQNRQEMQKEINDKLEKGINLIVDRYYHSGIAYSAAKGLDLEWCIKADENNYKPDYVFYLSLKPEYAIRREGYGKEKFENIEFQQKIYDMYMELIDVNWIIFNANCPIYELSDRIFRECMRIITFDL
jgi:dTMP kinase